MNKLYILLLLILWNLSAGIEDHYRKLEFKLGSVGPDNIDYVYMINLDQRPERWEKCLKKLSHFGIVPERFSGIYGWTLSLAALNEMSLKFEYGMWTGNEAVMHFPPGGDGSPQMIFLAGASYGTAVFSGWTVKGTIGCSLSHFSVLYDALISGYQTIWVMEDDIDILKDPNVLSSLVEELYSLDPKWDLLYTDYDCVMMDKTKSIEAQIPWMWRPDMPFFNLAQLFGKEPLGSFFRIGSRMRAHSIIYSRSGIEKILAFYQEHGNFLPYDNEVAMIPEIRMYVVRDSVVSVQEEYSDTRYRRF